MSAHFHTPKRHPFLFYICYGLFIVNERLFKNKWFKNQLWDWIKMELFYIDGQCQHSGNCCRDLMIIKQLGAIDTQGKLKKLIKTDPMYKRFIPTYQTTQKKGADRPIRYYGCTCLNQENKCTSYDHRPKFCYNYPVSGLLMNNKLLKGCGYRIQRTELRPKIKNPQLMALIWEVENK